MCYKYQMMKTERNWILRKESAAFEKLVKDIALPLRLLDRWHIRSSISINRSSREMWVDDEDERRVGDFLYRLHIKKGFMENE